MQPLGKEQIDLADVLAKRGETGRVVIDVVGGAESFAGVQGNVARA